ncbi:hypothetical protein PU629_00330 [Pullulanibacillus sp. KACC 23026]|uniref:hypothetical protein n=1 Tax=Pullulanibacillus sp. KACC 23026 TaxID=3028315 RepID=UPI0023B19C5A|nr:hypothetical protein [Pullulanibacillus sp. KACC 23026]WEG12839.1 hypothetical protein PU629_00330 [Pullulanibacillus sp. KACC 23026]
MKNYKLVLPIFISACIMLGCISFIGFLKPVKANTETNISNAVIEKNKETAQITNEIMVNLKNLGYEANIIGSSPFSV